MAFRDRAGAFTPVNVFGGLGEGLGQALGGGFTKATRRPLFKKLADDFYNKRQETARLNTLAKMGLQSAPVEGDTQYPIFQQMMDLQMSPIGERTDVFMDRFEAGDDMEQAMKYLLTDPKVAGGSKEGSKKSKFELAQTAEAARAILMDANEAATKAEFELSKNLSDANWDAYQEAVDNLDRAAADYTVAAVDSGLTAAKVLPTSVSQRMTRMKSRLDQKNQEVGITNKLLDIGTKLTAGPEKAKAALAARTTWIDKQLANYKKYDMQLKGLIDRFNKDPDNENNAQLFAEAVKLLGLSIEPGLQVTTGEVDLFTGENWATRLLEVVPTVIRAVKGGTKAEREKWEAAANAAARQNPVVLYKVLDQASEAISKGMQSYQQAAESLEEDAINSADKLVSARLAFGEKELDPNAVATLKAAIPQIVGSGGVAGDLLMYQAGPYEIRQPTVAGGEETPPADPTGDGFGTYTEESAEDVSPGGILNSTIQEAAGNATTTDAVVSGLTSGGKKVTAAELRAKMKAKRAGNE